MTQTKAQLVDLSVQGINASNLSSGTIPDARFPATLPAISGANLTNLPSSGISNVVDDTTPQLGGNLDVLTREITTSTSNGDIVFTPDGTGIVKIKGAGSTDGTIQLNCSAQSHGVKIKSPAHSAGQSYTMILPDNQIAADKFLKVKSITGSGATAVGQLEYADAGGGLSSDAQYNTIGGTNAGDSFSGTDATDNTLIGYNAGTALTTGDGQVLIGSKAGESNTISTGLVAIGFEAGKDNVDGNKNVFIGYKAGNLDDGNGFNTCVGYQAGLNMNGQGENTLIGYNAGKSITTGYGNICVGNAGENITTARQSVAVGQYAGVGITTGEKNTCIGYSANAGNTGEKNTSLGSLTGFSLSSGQNNLLLGYYAGGSSSPSGAISTGSNNVVLGNNSISNLYCADTSISSSDSRDKTDVTNFTIGLNWIEALRPVTYRWDRRTWYGTDEEPYGTPDGSKKRQRLHIGFLAQEALAVEQANGYGNSNDDSLILNLTDDGMSYGMKYERLVPILVNAIKELSTRVKALEAG